MVLLLHISPQCVKINQKEKGGTCKNTISDTALACMLNGAIDQEEADTIISLIPQVDYMRIDSDHVIHLALSEQYAWIVKDFFLDE